MMVRDAARTSAASRSGGSDVVESVADAGDRFGGPARDGLGWHGLGAAAADRQSAAPAFWLPAATAVELSATAAGLSLSAATQLPLPAAAGISLLAAADGRTTAAATGLCQARLLYPWRCRRRLL